MITTKVIECPEFQKLFFFLSQRMIRWSNLGSRCNDLISQDLYNSLSEETRKKYEDFSMDKFGKLVFDNYTEMT